MTPTIRELHLLRQLQQSEGWLPTGREQMLQRHLPPHRPLHQTGTGP
jgi:hypothetical protein